MNKPTITRRDAMRTLAAGAAGATLLTHSAPAASTSLKGNIKQSVSRWCYNSIPWDDFCKACKEMGIVGVDLVGENDIPHLQKHGLVPTTFSGIGRLTDALNRKENHAKCMEQAKRLLPLAKKVGAPNVITFSGNRRGMSDEDFVGYLTQDAFS